MKCDYHLHSEYSDDSSTPMRSQAEQAVRLGLDELCFTDHVDYGVKFDHYDPRSLTHLANVDYSRYFAEIEEVRQEFADRLTIRAGLEFGVQTHTIPDYERLYSKYNDELDFILLSIHEIDDMELWGHEYQRGKSQAEYTRGYYEELLKIVQSYHDYSVLAHLDLIARYDGRDAYPFAKVRDIVAEILRTAIDDGKGIELNTSSWRYGLADTTPCREILRLYLELGGEILTLGSDAHNPGYLGAHMDEAREILLGLGYRSFCTFENMAPIFHTL
ncbi:MAG: histidinol-phosphatase HisJ family protein [Synergistaceae bacterium]|nr:histidinol-phosphatase HisJ family protein [Synergistaceae bacterium]